MKTNLILFFILITIVSCYKDEKKVNENEKQFLDKMLDFIIANKDNETIEFPSLYDSLSTGIPQKSILIIGNELEKRGFVEISAGYGNYPPRGPRIVEKVYQKGDCICVVCKIYYNSAFENIYEMAERINCLDSAIYFENLRVFENQTKKQ